MLFQCHLILNSLGKKIDLNCFCFAFKKVRVADE